MKYFMTAHGQTFNSHLMFLDRLRNRLRLREVNSLDKSDIVISFVPIVSRAGTDIEAALQAIPQTTKPVVLVVLHHTFSPHCITSESRLSVNRENVFAVDCLFHEDRGLLRCQRNDEALRVVTDNLTATGASFSSEHLPGNQAGISRIRQKKILMCLMWFIAFIAVIVVVGFLIYSVVYAHYDQISKAPKMVNDVGKKT